MAEIDEKIRPALTTLRLVVLAMLGGMAAVSLLALLSPGGPRVDPSTAFTLLIAVAVLTLSGLAGVALIPTLMVGAAQQRFRDRRRDELRIEELSAAWIPVVIVPVALAEGVGLFGAVVALIAKQPLALLATLAAAAVVLVYFPRRAGFDHFVESVTGRSSR